MVLLPPKWAAELVDKHPLPDDFLVFVMDTTSNWEVADQASAKYLVDWALAVCGASNKVGSKNASQLGLPLTDFDQTSEFFDDWAEAQLVQTLGAWKQVVVPGEGFGVGGVQPIFQVNMLNLPQPSLSQMDMAYNRGAEAHKCATETVVVTGTKYTPKQLIHLLAFCGFSSREKDLIP